MNNQMLKLYISCFVFFSFMFQGASVFALTLDPSFGGTGLVRTKVGHHEDRAQAVVIQPDGKILVAGSSSNNANLDFALVRYLPDGSLDPSFNVNGQVVTLVGSDDDVALGIALQADGKIVICGHTFNGKDLDFALVRFTSNGNLDSDFGVNGMLTLAVGSGNDVATAVAIQPDGAILVAGSIEEDSGKVGALVRVLAHGAPDLAFGNAGAVRIDGGDHDEIAAMAIQKDQRIVVAGSREQNGQKRVLLVRLLADGSLDSGFGVDGVADTLIDSRDAIGRGLWMGEDGSILVAGSVGYGDDRDVALFRFTGQGRLDTDFAGGVGMLSHGLSGEDDVGYAVAANSTTVFVAGYTTVDGLRYLTLWQCLLSDGSLQELSPVTPEMSLLDGVANALALQADAKVVAAGFSEEGEVSTFVLARYAGKEVVGSKEGGSGLESSYVITTPISEITRVGCFAGGEIKTGSGMTFSRRGVVYSIAPYPVLTSSGVVDSEQIIAKSGELTTAGAQAEEQPVSSSAKAVGSVDTKASSISSTATGTSTTDPGREGFTSNGAGVGRYSAILTQLTPGKRYYVRAYGLTSENSVYYGQQLSFETKDACFIATAAYGSLLDPHVQTLRLFRDRCLLQHEAGRIFVRLYYHYSPPLAEFIADQPVLRLLVRIVLLPIVFCSYLALHLGGTGICLALLALLGTAAAVFNFREKCQKI